MSNPPPSLPARSRARAPTVSGPPPPLARPAVASRTQGSQTTMTSAQPTPAPAPGAQGPQITVTSALQRQDTVTIQNRNTPTSGQGAAPGSGNAARTQDIVRRPSLTITTGNRLHPADVPVSARTQSPLTGTTLVDSASRDITSVRSSPAGYETDVDSAQNSAGSVGLSAVASGHEAVAAWAMRNSGSDLPVSPELSPSSD